LLTSDFYPPYLAAAIYKRLLKMYMNNKA